jgi:sarcosine oxidase
VDYVGRYLPGLDPEPSAEATCLYTTTPTENFLIDRVDGLVVVSPCSGHGAKFAPTVGRIAADLATGTRSRTLDPFSFQAHAVARV